jgi:hypothetical protein
MRSEFKPVGVLSRVTAILALLLTAPLALWPILQAALRGRRVFRPVVAIRPRMRGTPLTGDTMVYYELGKARGWLRRWPQLWNVARGQFAWVGNRPLAPKQARLLSNDFERLWFAVRPGLISLADTESGSDVLDDGARANASYYAAHANWRLDWKVFLRALFLFAFGVSVSRAREACSRFFHAGRERKAY